MDNLPDLLAEVQCDEVYLLPPEADDLLDLGAPWPDDDPWYESPSAVAPHAPGQIVPPADWLDDQASFYRSQDTPMGDWLAARIAALADDWRTTGAREPGQHDGRLDALDAGPVFSRQYPPAAETFAALDAEARAAIPGDCGDRFAYLAGSLQANYKRLLADYHALAARARDLQHRADSCDCLPETPR